MAQVVCQIGALHWFSIHHLSLGLHRSIGQGFELLSWFCMACGHGWSLVCVVGDRGLADLLVPVDSGLSTTSVSWSAVPTWKLSFSFSFSHAEAHVFLMEVCPWCFASFHCWLLLEPFCCIVFCCHMHR